MNPLSGIKNVVVNALEIECAEYHNNHQNCIEQKKEATCPKNWF
jgi:hypothetical protein